VILGLETSCDETCAALVEDDGTVVANVVASQSSFHERYGGVVPEIASRRHLELVGPVVRTALADGGLALRDVDRIAVTAGPGLVGALLVGVSAAKAYAYASGRPLVPVDHLHGHVASLFLAPDAVEPPLMVLLASGGHTLLLRVEAHDRFTVLGRSLDDAAGEALDKGARLLGLGYPGGPAIERLARDGDPDRIALPTPMAGRAGLDLSFSGLKTALLHRVQERESTLAEDRADLAAAYQRAVVRALVERAVAAAVAHDLPAIGVVGGVAANGELRTTLAEAAAAHGVAVHAAPLAYCGDNAAMIASAARYRPALAYPALLDVDAYARAPLDAA
jgi:N6-L-threonylcarbamoyladenine synthase